MSDTEARCVPEHLPDTAEGKGRRRFSVLFMEIVMPDPLHPAIVHFPIVLAVLLPIVILAALVVTLRGSSTRSWLVVVAFGGALALSSWFAIETGEEQEDAVEEVVPRAAIHEHEEAAEALLITSGILFLLLAAGVAPGRVGKAARIVSAPASLVLLVMAFRVGGSGGELVYEHGAAAAYVTASGSESTLSGRDRDDDEDEHEEEEHRRR
jgi:uncharacterized membrane protein